MHIWSLEAYGVHADLLAAWEQRYGPELLPVQAQAVTEGRILTGASVVVDAPTGAGKTFVGEMAGVRAALAGRRVVYIVPTKALAEAKFADFSGLYGPLGLRVLITTRDRRGTDAAVGRGEFDILIAVPEKLRSLLMHSPATRTGIGCVVADELQLLSDPERGVCLELLLSEFRAMQPPPQIVGLSATLPNADELAGWLGAVSIHCKQRPVELRRGVLCDGSFAYLEHNGGRAGEEEFAAAQGDDAVQNLLSHFAAQAEPTLVFLRDKRTSIQLAHRLADCTALIPAQEAQERIARLQPTGARRKLWQLLAHGVAFHNSDMQFDERQIIEEAFTGGEIGILCATSTLAMGVNLPARNVLIDPYHWEQPPPGSFAGQAVRPALAPLSRAEFENMAGRAGRLQFGEEFGRAIVLADTPLVAAALMERYVHAALPELVPALGRQHPTTQLLALCAATSGQLAAAYRNTLTAYHAGLGSCIDTGSALPAHLQLAAREAQRRGLLESVDPLRGGAEPSLESSPFGRLCASSGISVEGFCWLRESEQQLGGTPPNDMEALGIATMCPDTWPLNFSLGFAEARAHDYSHAFVQEACELGMDTPLLHDLLGAARVDVSQRARSAKLALMLLRWSSVTSTIQLEEELSLPAARLEGLAESVGWILEVLAGIGRQLGWTEEACGRIERLAERISSGLPVDALGLRALRDRGVNRDQILGLLRRGIERVSELSDQELADLTARGELAPEAPHEAAFRAPKTEAPPAEEPAHAHSRAPASSALLVLDHRSPDRVLFRGAEVRMRPFEYRLLFALASQPGHCVGYEDLYRTLWDDGPIVEKSQVNWHRHKVSRKLMQSAGMRAGDSDPIETVPRMGYRLRLTPTQVRMV